MGLILDIIVVVVIVLCVILSARYGFLRTLIETIGYFLSFVVASFTAKPLADLIFENAAKPFLFRIIENSLTNATDSLMQNFPTYLLTIFKIAGVDEEALSLMLSEGVRSATASLITAVEPHVVNMICSALTAMLTVLLIVVVSIVAKRVNNLCKETAFNKPNLIIGGLIGLLKGTVISVLFTFFVGFCIALTGKGFLIFTNDALESSYICKFILETFSRLINGGLSL